MEIRKLIQTFVFLLLAAYIYSIPIYINSEEEIKNIYVIGSSTVSKSIFIIPADLLKNLSDENKDIIKKMQNTGNSEFAGTTYTEVILPVLFKAQLIEDVKEQIEIGRKVYREIFDSKPSVFYPHMGVVSHEISEILEQSGYTVFVTSSGERVDLQDEALLPEPDLARWIGASVQKLAWDYLKRARVKLNDYVTSESYNSEKFRAAVEELYLLEKPVWFENYVSNDTDKKRESDLWFRAGLSNIYRVIGFDPPSEISVPLFVRRGRLSNLPLTNLATGEYLVYFNDDEDDVVLSSCNIIAFGVKKSSDNIIFDIFISSRESETVDVYIDMNNKNDAGSTSFIPGHNGFTDSLSAWEYAISISSETAYLFRYNRNGPPVRVGRFTVEKSTSPDIVELKIPDGYIRGNPENWGYVVVGFLPSGNIFDIIGSDTPTEDTIIQIPALRMK